MLFPCPYCLEALHIFCFFCPVEITTVHYNLTVWNINNSHVILSINMIEKRFKVRFTLAPPTRQLELGRSKEPLEKAWKTWTLTCWLFKLRSVNMWAMNKKCIFMWKRKYAACIHVHCVVEIPEDMRLGLYCAYWCPLFRAVSSSAIIADHLGNTRTSAVLCFWLNCTYNTAFVS